MKRPGRPSLDPRDPSVRVNLSLPGKGYDDLYTKARVERVSVPELIRRHIADANKRDRNARK